MCPGPYLSPVRGPILWSCSDLSPVSYLSPDPNLSPGPDLSLGPLELSSFSFFLEADHVQSISPSKSALKKSRALYILKY